MNERKEMEGTYQPFQRQELKQKHLKVLDVPQKKEILMGHSPITTQLQKFDVA